MTSAGASAFRSCETWYCSAFPAVAGGPSGQSSSMSRSAETTSFARVSSSASSARCLGPPSASVRPCSTTSSGPRIRNSTSCLRGRRYHRPHRLSEPSAAPQAPGWLGPTTRVWWREGRLEHVSVETDIHTGSDFVGYRLEQLVGEGGMGVVYRAYDRRMKRTVALKFVAPTLALDERFRERFLREIELASGFEHPNVVPIHDAGDVDGRLYLAMRYVEGSDLSTLLRSEAPLDPRRAIRICGQVARALDAAHRIGLVHRDVKPSNVLLDAGEHVYLADFGLTRRLVDEGSPPLDGRSLGTPAYVAPEQLEGEPVDGRTDLYSLACLLFECLTGEPPFPHESRLAVAWAHLEDEPPSACARNAALPAAVDDVLSHGLAKDPADRQQSCAALIAATEAALGLERPRRSRRRILLIAAAAAVLAAVAAAGVATIISGSDGGAADPPLYGAPGSVVRIDPEHNAVVAVVPVGLDPQAVAVHGSRVWVFNQVDGAVASVDETTNRVVQTTPVHARPVDVSAYAGPVIAADAGGAWLIGSNDAGRPVLVRITGSGRRPTVYPLDRDPRGVAVGYGAVWVVAQGERDSQLLRIDPATGRITHRTRVGGRIDSVAAGLGYVWAVGSSRGTLYRFDARTGRRRGHLLVGTNRAPRPYLMRGFVWVGLTVFRPRTFDTVKWVDCCSADSGEAAGGFGSAWSTDSPTGTVVRWGSGWDVAATVRVVAVAPDFAHRLGEPPGGGCPTSIAAGADSIWVTVASSETYSCGSRGAGAKATRFWLGFEGAHAPGTFTSGIQHEGHFTASAPLCAAGDAVDIGQVPTYAAVRRHTCSDGSGSFTARIAPVVHEHGKPGRNRGGWQIVAGSGDYAKLRGKGTFTAIHLGGDLDDNATITYRTTWNGVVDFDDTAPDLTFTRASVHRVKRGTYRLDVALRS